MNKLLKMNRRTNRENYEFIYYNAITGHPNEDYDDIVDTVNKFLDLENLTVAECIKTIKEEMEYEHPNKPV